jgi:hypothetical protein
MDDAVGERDGHRRIRGDYVDSRAALYSTPGEQASRACFDLEFRIALRRSQGSVMRAAVTSCEAKDRNDPTVFDDARFLKRPASWRGTGLRVAPTGEEFVDCDHRGANDDGDGRHHENSFDHGFPLADLNVRTPEESCSRKTRELRGRAIGRGWVANTRPATSVISLAP